ncbi:TIGR02996 domain-containing protein [Pyxidicoccus fallax]|uniref:TIGR02996 domain-containing protein n=1 Tax=Pyxidicoccus fallax TaxID=394095 RepID=A0A848LB85_9BACT|nr:TIGR02996 domain-containing protein [Pyxidicoccus fallax]NMO15764.1 TIGR02996 domain-containing protein [Pyxidicoccus fallax]NPC77302.1 TIGR02996 domain-containing protein [Pyxidicoccus fallax]
MTSSARTPRGKTSKSPSLAEAVALGEWPHVLTALLEAWRAAPNRELADRVVAVGARLAGGGPLPGAWEDVAKTPDPTVLSALLDTLTDKGSVKARARLEALEAWPEDPRIDRWVADRYADPPFTSTGARPFWTRLAPLARRIRDTRAAQTLVKARGGYDADIPYEAFLAGHVDRIRSQLDAAIDVELSAEHQDALAAVDEALRAQSEAEKPARAEDAEALLARVLETPEDDEARAVLADVLLEAGHPRGELITLQLEATRRPLTPAEVKRERQLLKTARKELLGPLEAVLKPDCVFSRGFLSRAALKQGNSRALESAIEKVAGHPLWATVEHLEGGGDYDITTHPVMKSLRSLTHSNVGWEELARLPRLEVLVERGTSANRLQLARSKTAFPKLRELDLPCFFQHARELLESPLVARLERFHLRVDVPDYDPAHAEEALALLALVPTLKVPDLTLRMVRHHVMDWSSGFRFMRDPAGRLSVRVFTTEIHERYEELVQADVLRGLDHVAKLQPASLVVAHQLRTGLREAVEQRALALGATLEND